MSKRRLLIATILLLASGTSAFAQLSNVPETATVSGQDSSSPSNVPPDQSPISTPIDQNVPIAAGDLLNITVFDTPEMTQSVRVSKEGTITLALIGAMQAAGATPQELEQSVAKALMDGHYLKNPQVSILINQHVPTLGYVAGEVVRPGAYAIPSSTHLSDLLALAGGLTQKAGNSAVITRKSSGETIHVDLVSADEKERNPEILPGDHVSVNLTGIVYVLGEVNHPGGYLIDRRSSITLMKALTFADGITQTGSLSKASLYRGEGVNRQETPINLKKILKTEEPDIPIQAGDIIYVYGSATRGLGRRSLETLLATASLATVYAGTY